MDYNVIAPSPPCVIMIALSTQRLPNGDHTECTFPRPTYLEMMSCRLDLKVDGVHICGYDVVFHEGRVYARHASRDYYYYVECGLPSGMTVADLREINTKADEGFPTTSVWGPCEYCC